MCGDFQDGSASVFGVGCQGIGDHNSLVGSSIYEVASFIRRLRIPRVCQNVGMQY